MCEYCPAVLSKREVEDFLDLLFLGVEFNLIWHFHKKLRLQALDHVDELFDEWSLIDDYLAF